MSAFRPQQRRITIEGRDFHFVAYESVPANPKRDQEAEPAMWYLMVGGHRHPVLPYDDALSEEEVDKALSRWAKKHAMAAPDKEGNGNGKKASPTNRRNQNWWGPN